MPKRTPNPYRLFGALGDPTRLAVIQRLCRGPETVSRLAEPFDMALPSFVQHLGVLEEAGWIESSKQGRVRTCEIVPAALQATAGWLLQQHGIWAARLQQLDAYLLSLNAVESR